MLKNSDTTLAYIAGLVDGEAYIGIKKTKAYRCQGRVTPGYHERIQIRMVDEAAIKFISESFGGWYYKEKPNAVKGRPLYCFQASDLSAESILRAILPYLRIKRESAETVLRLRTLKRTTSQHRTKITGQRSFPNKYGTIRMVATKCLSDEFVAQCDILYLRCKTLNRVGV
jgi:hypothetical protein